MTMLPLLKKVSLIHKLRVNATVTEESVLNSQAVMRRGELKPAAETPVVSRRQKLKQTGERYVRHTLKNFATKP